MHLNYQLEVALVLGLSGQGWGVNLFSLASPSGTYKYIKRKQIIQPAVSNY
jgi:hypothetical protein